MPGNVQQLLEERDRLLIQQKKIYKNSVSNLNMRYGELLKNDFGSTLVRNCARDAAGEVVRKYFDTSDFYVTVDALYDRIVHFSYENEPDPLAESETAIRKELYNRNDDPRFSETLKTISADCQKAQKKLHEKETYTDKNGKEHRRYVDQKLMQDGKDAYREEQRDANGKLYDELSGNSSDTERLEVDHIQAAATARYNSRYLNTPEAVEAMKEFYNSSDNFQMLEKRANASKGDVRVYADGDRKMSDTEIKEKRKAIRDDLKQKYVKEGLDEKEAGKKAATEAENEITRKYDVTYKASAKEVTDAVCNRWENTTGKTREELIRTGKLNEDGTVPEDVKKKLEEELRHSMNAESKVILRHTDYTKVSSDALEHTKKGMVKIITGQVIYYVLPPFVFETQCILRKKDMTLDRFFEELKRSGKRIVNYVKSKLKDILKHILGNGFQKFLKSFFDIIIETVKETVKRLLRLAKDLVLSIVQCAKVIASKESSPAEKADAVTRILATTVTSVVLEILFEYMEKQFGLPDLIMEPLQLIVTILATNLVMLVLEQADLFDVQYGLLLANIETAYQEEWTQYQSESKQLLTEAKVNMENALEKIQNQVAQIQTNIKEMNLYTEDVVPQLNQINQIYNMGIDFDLEWKTFCAG